MQVKVGKYRHGDALIMGLRKEMIGSITVEQLADCHNGMTFRVDDRPVVIAGIRKVWDGRSLAWALVGRDIPMLAWRRILAFGRIHLQDEFENTRRIEAYTPRRWKQAVKTLEFLGFQTEAVLKDFAPDGDYILGVYDG